MLLMIHSQLNEIMDQILFRTLLFLFLQGKTTSKAAVALLLHVLHIYVHRSCYELKKKVEWKGRNEEKRLQWKFLNSFLSFLIKLRW